MKRDHICDYSGLCFECDALSPSQQAKAAGLKSLRQVAQTTKQSEQTLNNWHKNKSELFAVVIAGCVKVINGEDNG